MRGRLPHPREKGGADTGPSPVDLALIDGIPPVAGRPGRPRRRPEALLGDKGYDSNPNRDELRRRRILPVILWITGPYPVLTSLGALAASITALGENRSPVDGFSFGQAPGGRVTVRVLPDSTHSSQRVGEAPCLRKSACVHRPRDRSHPGSTGWRQPE